MMCTMSWSAGAGKHLSTSDGWFVKNKSSVALCLVGKLTICSRPQFWIQSSSLWLIATALEFPSIAWVVQLMSGRLRSPPTQKIAFLVTRPYIWYQEHTHTTKSYRSTLRLSNSWQQHVRMENLAENDLTYFYLHHVVIVVAAVITISLPPVNNSWVLKRKKIMLV